MSLSMGCYLTAIAASTGERHMDRYEWSVELKEFSREVIYTARKSYPSQLGQPDLSIEINHKPVIDGVVEVRAVIADKENSERNIAT